MAISGQLKYQNRLNHYNLPFFIASDAFFTNYFVSHYLGVVHLVDLLRSGLHIIRPLEQVTS